MPRPRKAPPRPEDLPTLWEVPDALWGRIAPLIAEVDPPKPTGRPRIDARRALEAIPCGMRGGGQWNHLPRDLPDDSSAHRTFQRWIALGVLDRIWATLVEGCEELGGGCGRAVAIRRRGAGQGAAGGDQIGPNPTDRGKRGAKRSRLVEAAGGPLAVVVAGANVHDTKLLAATLEAIVVERPAPTAERPQQLCLDKGDDTPTGEAAAMEHHCVPHIRRIGEEKLDPASGERRYPARRWVVERTLAWRSTCRALLVRYDKKAANFLGPLNLAGAPVWYRRLHRLSLLR